MGHGRNLDRRMCHLADGAMFGVVGKLVRMEMEGLRDNRHRDQEEAKQDGPAPGCRETPREIGLPVSHTESQAGPPKSRRPVRIGPL